MHPYIEVAKMRIYPAAVMLSTLMGTFFSPVYAFEKPYEQDFIITAYYSPLPDQCCYVQGNYEEEKMMNGEGNVGADGTPVYPGMIAAPKSYAFGTIIDLPGIGVGTVHDRGSAIVEWGDDAHRLDIWVGVGEEGLARALAWGIRHVKGTVYPAGYEGVPGESIALNALDSDLSILARLPKSDVSGLLTLAKANEGSYAVRVLQDDLRQLGYFSEKTNGFFGPATQAAYKAFLADYGFSVDGQSVGEKEALTLITALTIKDGNLPDVPSNIGPGGTGSDVRQAQKLLRYLGYYRGRTNGVFDEGLKAAILAFQLKEGIVKQSLESGAGRIGPATAAAIQKEWKVKVVKAKTAVATIKKSVATRVKAQEFPRKTLSDGDRGSDVEHLQQFLVSAGYLKGKNAVTGSFGERTRKALLKFQLDRSIIASAKSKGAGVYGPATRALIMNELIARRWQDVRAGGIEAL
jgi:peptidoglycan hydrolase-like protein with peptidoglycan-binding domain/3D (Asp-Asp-Asp) domain-containing protein